MSVSARADVSSFDREMVESFRNDRLHLILLPTEQCNFRCTYCYEDFAIGKMRPEVVQGVKRLIDRRGGDLAHLQISWFGGEPMLARSVVEEIASHASSVSTAGRLTYVSDMTTNGWLLDHSAAGRLADLGIRTFQVSLDGPAHCHDHTRLRADGRGTFDRIWGNLLSIRDSSVDVRVLLRIHVTPANLPSMPAFLHRVKDAFLADQRFVVALKRVARLGGPGDASMDVLAGDDERLAALREIVRGSLPEPVTFCYAARANSLMVRADGRLGKCTVGMSEPRNTVGRLRPDGTLDIDQPRFRQWLQGWETGDQESTRCPYRALGSRGLPVLQVGERPGA
ncbi:radical SAM protein [Nonomuraea glycinis]|uniref:Radical SAM core domain-containing protein n=1 Tax=Nonomuraea glycinis TaxID=2047744 RepID=A0A918A076_9ACTN|nr:radical SAM protein [Nonomuraea glycinis]MCA2177106.1 radical SAM protein [Nonomuraea glycinis]GGP02653.1 hypothetical protein GCM10012278_10730 [Nonomuraea glycinis]